MPQILLETFIRAPIEQCFNLSRSIDLHTISTAGTKEKAIAGRTHGLIELNETVTWRATHFCIRQKLTSKIKAFEKPFYFRDEQLRGAFRFMKHDHIFTAVEDGTLMKDVFHFEAPLGLLGRIADKLVLTKYMTRFLTERNAIIKKYAEAGQWNHLLLPENEVDVSTIER